MKKPLRYLAIAVTIAFTIAMVLRGAWIPAILLGLSAVAQILRAQNDAAEPTKLTVDQHREVALMLRATGKNEAAVLVKKLTGVSVASAIATVREISEPT